MTTTEQLGDTSDLCKSGETHRFGRLVAAGIVGTTRATKPRAELSDAPRVESEHQLQRELNLPRSGGRRGNLSRGGADAAARENNSIGVRKVSLIENIEELGAELQSVSLGDLELLEEGGIHVDQARAAECSAPGVAESSGEGHEESVGIEPLIRVPQNYRPGKVRIPVGDVGRIGVAGSRNIGAN